MDEDEQARVMSQAQALLDCTADLVEHCGVLAAVDVLQVIPLQGVWSPLEILCHLSPSETDIVESGSGGCNTCRLLRFRWIVHQPIRSPFIS